MLITDEYQREQRLMHRNPKYGAASKKFAGHVAALIHEVRPRSILDYGAGKCALRQALGRAINGIGYREYDPGVKAISRRPPGLFDLICCIDVLEHIEPDCLDDVLSHLRSKAGKLAFLTIHTGPAGKFLSDGRNAHLIQKPIEWWVDMVRQRFREVRADMVNETTAILVCEV